MGPETEDIHYLRTSCGQVTRVSSCDYERYRHMPIYYGGRRSSSAGYAHISLKISRGKFRTALLHRLIMNAPVGLQVDHINGNTLDNRRENLRLCTIQQNALNRRRKTTSRSPYKGVTWDKSRRNWKAILGRKHLGAFKSPEEAKACHDKAARNAYGEFFNDGRAA